MLNRHATNLSNVDTIVDMLEARARTHGDHLAVTVDGEGLTFGALCDDARWLAGRLAALGVGKDTRCALVLPTSLDFVRAVFGVQMAGGAPVAIDSSLSADRLVRRLDEIAPVLTISTSSRLSEIRGLARARVVTCAALASVSPCIGRTTHRATAADLAYLQFTSGSTGEPRAAQLSHRSLMAGLRAIEEAFDIGVRDVMASCTPLHYSPGIVRSVFGPVAFGCPAHLVPPSASGLLRWLELATSVSATITSAPDFAYRVAARTVPASRVNLQSLRIATSGGEAIRADTITAFERHFNLQRIVQAAYGLSEATLVVATCAPGSPMVVDDAGCVSCGPVVGGLEARIAGPDGRACAAGEEGEILVRGAAVFDGYFRDEASTASALRGGWLHTGDIGRMDRSGALYPRARGRALIKRAGASIAPREIEERVDALAGVMGSAAIGVPSHAGHTDRIVVVVEVDRHWDGEWSRLAVLVESTVRGAVGASIGGIVIVEPHLIPRGSSGKVRYADLQRLLLSGSLQRDALFVGQAGEPFANGSRSRLDTVYGQASSG